MILQKIIPSGQRSLLPVTRLLLSVNGHHCLWSNWVVIWFWTKRESFPVERLSLWVTNSSFPVQRIHCHSSIWVVNWFLTVKNHFRSKMSSLTDKGKKGITSGRMVIPRSLVSVKGSKVITGGSQIELLFDYTQKGHHICFLFTHMVIYTDPSVWIWDSKSKHVWAR